MSKMMMTIARATWSHMHTWQAWLKPVQQKNPELRGPPEALVRVPRVDPRRSRCSPAAPPPSREPSPSHCRDACETTTRPRDPGIGRSNTGNPRGSFPIRKVPGFPGIPDAGPAARNSAVTVGCPASLIGACSCLCVCCRLGVLVLASSASNRLETSGMI